MIRQNPDNLAPAVESGDLHGSEAVLGHLVHLHVTLVLLVVEDVLHNFGVSMEAGDVQQVPGVVALTPGEIR